MILSTPSARASLTIEMVRPLAERASQLLENQLKLEVYAAFLQPTQLCASLWCPGHLQVHDGLSGL